jgi:hypothetical protein
MDGRQMDFFPASVIAELENDFFQTMFLEKLFWQKNLTVLHMLEY